MSAFWPARGAWPAVPPGPMAYAVQPSVRRASQLAANAARHSLFERHTGAFGQAAHFVQQVRAVPLEHRLELRHAMLELLVRKFRPGAHHLDVRPDLAGSLLAVLAAQFPVSAARLVERVFRLLARGDRQRHSRAPRLRPTPACACEKCLDLSRYPPGGSGLHYYFTDTSFTGLRPLPTPLRLRIGISARPA